MLLCQQKQKAQLIAYILTMDILSADSDIEADWKAGKVLCAVFITQIDDLIEFQPQAFNDIQRSLRIQTSKLPVLAIIRIQYFIQTSGREAGGIAFHMQDDKQNPHGLYRLMKRFSRPFGQRLTDFCRLYHILLPVRMLLCFLLQFIMIPHQKAAYSIHHKKNAFIEGSLLLLTVQQVLLCLLFQAGRPLFQPLTDIGADMSLCMILLIDFYNR